MSATKLDRVKPLLFTIFLIISVSLVPATAEATETDPHLNAWEGPIDWLKNNLVDYVKEAIQDMLSEITASVVDGISSALGTGWDFVTSLPSTISELLSNAANTTWNVITENLGTAWDFLQTLPSSLGEAVTDIAFAAADEISARLGDTWDYLLDLPQTASELIITPIQNFIMSIPDTIVSLFTDTLDMIEATIEGMFGFIEDSVPAELAALAPILGMAIFVAAILIIYFMYRVYKGVPVVG